MRRERGWCEEGVGGQGGATATSASSTTTLPFPYLTPADSGIDDFLFFLKKYFVFTVRERNKSTKRTFKLF